MRFSYEHIKPVTIFTEESKLFGTVNLSYILSELTIKIPYEEYITYNISVAILISYLLAE
jgi:hypothetical protein